MNISFARTATVAALLAARCASGAAAPPDDPYRWLEDAHGTRAMSWVEAENAKTTTVLEKDPRYAGLYRDALAIAQAQDRIPTPTIWAGAVYNLWQDTAHVRGIWRRSSFADYASADPHWSTVLDVDALAASEKANWFLKTSACLEPAETRCLLSLSDGGEDAITVREFDLPSASFPPNGFSLPTGKQEVAWEDANTLLLARAWQPGEQTASGYAYIVKRLRRGQALSEAQEVFRGSPQDIGVEFDSLSDGSGHRALVISRSVNTFESEKYLVTGGKVLRMAMPKKAELLTLIEGQVVLRLAEEWAVAGRIFKSGSLAAFDLNAAARNPEHLAVTLIYEPRAREALSDAQATRDALIVTTFDNVRGRAWVYRRSAGGAWSPTALTLPDNATIDIKSADLHSARLLEHRRVFRAAHTLAVGRSDGRAGGGEAAAGEIRCIDADDRAVRSAVE